ncbi:SusC/RagA family TonB-linked outer membrane protein [Phocaeicola sp.]
MKIKILTQKGKCALLAGALGMLSNPSFSLSTGDIDISLPNVTQQVAKIKGKILDTKTGEAIIGANVLVKGTTNGTITNFDGEYELDAPVGSTLIISYIGYKSIEVKAIAEPQTIKLAEDSETLDEVIVVGYTTQRKESLTGAMSNIKSSKLKDVTTPSVENMLNGKVPGVYVAPGSGQPGSNGAVVIRGQATINGSTAPLWVIDGVIVGSDAGQLNPSDIESMTILKDAASTAIYGSEGANGVIVVTTKNARVEKMTINASVKLGISTLNNGNVEMMNGEELYDYYSSFQNADMLTSLTWWKPELRNRNFDWWDLATKTGFTQDYNISLQGGNEKIQSYFSLGYYDEEGAVKGYDYKRYNFRFKTTYKPYEWLTIKPSFTGSRRDIYDQQYSVTAMYKRLPWDSPYDAEGNLEPDRSPNWVDGSETNYLLDFSYGNYSESTHYELMGNFDFDVKITDWLIFSSVNNYIYTNNSSHSYTDPRSGSVENVKGRLTEWRSDVTRRYTNQKLLINKNFGKHSINGLIAYEFNDYRYKNLDIYGTGFVPGFEVLDVVANSERTKGGILEWAKQSYFTQWKYAYDNKYLAELSLRRDGASNFGDNAKYGNFFSFSAGWNINHENWFNVDWVDNLKLRASYGSVGNRPSSLYPQYDLYSVSASYDTNPGALISSIGNKGLTWEKTFTTGFGLDATLFQDRLRFNFDYYIKNTDNILYRVPVTGLTGVTRVWRNVGKMRNVGYELSIGGDIIRTKDWNWSVDFNMGHNSNELRDLFKQLDDNGNYVVKPVIIDDGTTIAGSAQRILEIGEPVDTYWIREWAGVNPENGAPMWYMNDENGNKVTTSDPSKADLYKCGKASPDLFGGFSTSLSWKNVDLSAVFGYSIGGQIYNYSRLEYDSDGAYGDRNQMKLQKGWSRWQKPGDIATHPVAKYDNKDQGNVTSSRFLEDSDYLKLRSLTIGYNMKLPQWGIQNLRVYFTGENLFTITDYSGVDPEIPAGNNPDDNLSVMGTAGPSVYPSVRKFMFGLNLTF